MKKVTLKDSNLKAKDTLLDSHIPHSQSPPHRKLIKKIENIQHNNTNVKNDCSLQDKLIYTQSKEETRDFRAEIELRYKKSLLNRNYCFPLQKMESSCSHSSTSSDKESMELLQYVTVYDLASQNLHKKHQKSRKKLATDTSQTANYTNTQHQDFKQPSQSSSQENRNNRREEEHEDADIPLEILIRDKSSSAYKNLIKTLQSNSTFSHNLVKPKEEKRIQIETKPLIINKEVPKNQNSDNLYDVEKNRDIVSPTSQNTDSYFKNPSSSVYQSRVDISSASKNNQRMKQRCIKSELDSVLSKTNTSSQNNRPIFSQQDKCIEELVKVSSNDTFSKENRAPGASESLHSLRTKSNSKKALSSDKNQNIISDSIPSLGEDLGKSSLKRNFQSKISLVETGKLSTDSLKKIDSNSNTILKLSSPSSTNTKSQRNFTQSRELIFKSFHDEGVRTQFKSSVNPNLTINQPAESRNLNTQLSSLYQRAQKEVLNTKHSKIQTFINQNNEAKIVLSNMTEQDLNLNLKLNSSTSPTHASTKRGQTPQNQSKVLVSSSQNTNPNTRYASPSYQFERVPTAKKMRVITFSKKSAAKALDFVSQTNKNSPTGNDFNLSKVCLKANKASKNRISHKFDLSNYSQLNKPPSQDSFSKSRILDITSENFLIDTQKQAGIMLQEVQQKSVKNRANYQSSITRNFK